MGQGEVAWGKNILYTIQVTENSPAHGHFDGRGNHNIKIKCEKES